jgi:hypothetical protein
MWYLAKLPPTPAFWFTRYLIVVPRPLFTPALVMRRKNLYVNWLVNQQGNCMFAIPNGPGKAKLNWLVHPPRHVFGEPASPSTLAAAAHGFSAEFAPPPGDKQTFPAAPGSTFVQCAHRHAYCTVYVHTPRCQLVGLYSPAVPAFQ